MSDNLARVIPLRPEVPDEPRLPWLYWDHGLAFGLFPNWGWWQEVRCWRDLDLRPALRSAFRTFPR